MKRRLLICVVLIIAVTMLIGVVGCGHKPKAGGSYMHDEGDEWKTKFDLSLPDLEGAGASQESANAAGWYMTLDDDFEGNALPSHWNSIGNKRRFDEYWCDSMLSIKDGEVVINSKEDDNHPADKCGGKKGYFTSGIITCDTSKGGRDPIFEQAFGYYECRVKIPDATGMWSAFWLQTNSTSNQGCGGEDGSEIDIFESNFPNMRDHVASNVIYDGYGAPTQSLGAVHSVGVDTYEGYHTYALKWTPTEYVFYFDGEPTWATDHGGVCKVPAFLMLTCEIRKKGTNGPHGQKIGAFDPDTFNIDYVKVYQNTAYLPHIKSPQDFV